MIRTESLRNKNLYETCNKQNKENFYQNQLRTQTFINNINENIVKWNNCETCNVVVRSANWNKHLFS